MIFRKKRQVSTTTWPARHVGTFEQLRSRLEHLAVSAPTVLEVGPGATTTLLRRHLAPGEGERLSWLANRRRAFLRNVDGLLRRLPGMPLCSYEPGELRRFLPPASKLIVADISPAVIQAIQTQYPDVEARVIDFAAEPLPMPVDVIVCLCVLVRALDPKPIFANLYRSLKSGGLLVMDHRSCTSFGAPELPLESLAPQLWRKP